MTNLWRLARTINNTYKTQFVHGRNLADCGSSKSGGDDKEPSKPEDLNPPCCGYPIFSTPGRPTTYDVRKYGHFLPGCTVPDRFEGLPCMPNGIFRCTAGEQLGPGADKCGFYTNPEYFSYNHMSFFDLHLILCPWRMPQPCSCRKL